MWTEEEMKARYDALFEQRFASGVALRRARRADARALARAEGLRWAISKFYPALTASRDLPAEASALHDSQAPASAHELISARNEALREASVAAEAAEKHVSAITALDKDMRGLERLMWGYHRVELQPPSEEEMGFASLE